MPILTVANWVHLVGDFNLYRCKVLLLNAKLIHWDARRELNAEEDRVLHNLLVGIIFSAIGHAHDNPAMYVAHNGSIDSRSPHRILCTFFQNYNPRAMVL